MTGSWDGSNRRRILKGIAALGAASQLGLPGAKAANDQILTRPIPSSGERIPILGMGTWVTFNVGDITALRDERTEVLRTFLSHGGGMVDSSPMYGSSQAVVGYALDRIERKGNLLAADKVWTRDGDATHEQVAESRDHWRIDRFDVMQVHNLLSWKEHLATLRAMKEAGQVRYIGVTTSHGSRHGEMEAIMKSEPIDFVQFTYNVQDRKPEERLLPLAADRGIGVIVNRPFQRKALIERYQDEKLPGWAADFGARTWPQFLLKFIVSHPAVTCAIPATSRVDHMKENMQAAYGVLPEAKTRERMIAYVEGL